MWSKLTTLIPPPWGVVVHYGLYVAIALSLYGYGRVQGMDYEEHKQEIIHAKQVDVATQLRAKQDAGIHAAGVQYQKEKPPAADQPAIASGISTLCTGGRVRHGAAGPGHAPVPPVPGGRVDDGGHPGAPADGRGPEIPQGIESRIAADATNYPACYAKLRYVIGVGDAAGASTP